MQTHRQFFNRLYY